MPIAALSENAVRAIGSSQALTDPCSVVKELIDNALDARATSIFVEISLNTLEVIQVKDNGYGIGPEDRAMVGRRYCTSKIRSLEDLKDIGGRSLGFRGEALASAAELSGSLVVTTRIEGEGVAASLKINRSGEVESQEMTSHPTGSTVRVIDFLKHLPVRKQTALKTAPKTLAKIKQTMQAYAIARPSTRLSLKVLKAKNDKGNWVYAPKAGASVADAAMKVVDRIIPAHCQWISWRSSGMEIPVSDIAGELQNIQDEDGGNSVYRIEAFLPNPDGDASVIGTAGSFISIDSRPVTCTRGILKELITIYKRYIRSASLRYKENIANPFLCMNIVCPLGSYDANVEPAKDDVLFVDQSRLLSILEAFFKSVYGELEVKGGKEVHKVGSQHEPKDQKGFDLLLATKPRNIACTTPTIIDIPAMEIGGNAAYKSTTQGQSHVDADGALEQDKPWTETQEVVAGSASPSVLEKVGQVLRDTSNSENGPGEQNAAPSEPPSEGSRTWHFSMYDGDEEGLEEPDGMTTHPIEDEVVDGEGLKDVSVSNPWTIAKMNTFVHPGRRAEQDGANVDTFENGQLMTPARERIGHRASMGVPSNELVHGNSGNFANFQTPRPSLRSPSLTPKDFSSSGAWHFPSKAWGKARSDLRNDKARDRALERHSEGALDTWIRSSPSIGQPAEVIENGRFSQGPLDANGTHLLDAGQRVHGSSTDFISARTLQRGTQLSDIPEVPPKRTPRPGLRKQLQQDAIHKPFVSPVNDPSKVWFEMEPQRRSRPLPQAHSQSARNGIAATTPIRFESESEDIVEEPSLVNPTPPLSHSTQLNLEDLMEYEHHKSAATRAYKSSLRSQTNKGITTPNAERLDKDRLPSANSNSPHKNRYEAAKAALTPSKDNTDNLPAIFSDGDPRAYLIRVRKREEEFAQRDSIGSGGPTHKLRRARTTMLPLETIAADQKVHSLVLDVSTTAASVKKLEVEAMDADEYVRSGKIPCDLLAAISDSDVQTWEQKVSAMLTKAYRNAENGNRTEGMSFAFLPALRHHLVAYT